MLLHRAALRWLYTSGRCWPPEALAAARCLAAAAAAGDRRGGQDGGGGRGSVQQGGASRYESGERRERRPSQPQRGVGAPDEPRAPRAAPPSRESRPPPAARRAAPRQPREAEREPMDAGADAHRAVAPGQLPPALAAAAAQGLTPAEARAIAALAAACERVGAAACFTGATAAALQGCEGVRPSPLSVSLQWDALPALRAALLANSENVTDISEAAPRPGGAGFTASVCGCAADLHCVSSHVVAAETDRVAIPLPGGGAGWARSLLTLRRESAALAPAVSARLAAQQARLSAHNSEVWSRGGGGGGNGTYAAWTARFGPPAAAAAAIARDPVARLAPLGRHLVAAAAGGGRVVNLLGSHGHKAVALALLGARVAVVDVSPGNARYARELAAAAGVDLAYLVCDVLRLLGPAAGGAGGGAPGGGAPGAALEGAADAVLLEMGVLHYFVDLLPLMSVAARLLAPGGRLVLRDFHPASTKLLEYRAGSKKLRVAGNYFEQALAPEAAAFGKWAAGDAAAAGTVYLRRWTLGEIVTAAADAGLRIVSLEEEASASLADAGVPKAFTLVAEKQ